MIIKYPNGQFGGNPVARLQLEGLRLTETSYQRGLHIAPHSHELACFVFVLQGNFSETCGRRARECGPLTLLYRPAGEVHANRFSIAGGQCLNVELEPAWLAREFRQFDEVSPLAIEACLLEIVAAALRERAQPVAAQVPRWLVRSEEFLRAHYVESLAVTQVADAVGVHPAHLARVFRAHFGCTIGDYLRQLRIDSASRKLAETECALSEIATAAGFYDQAHFTRTFKRLTGLTPAEFRASTRPR